MMLSAFASDRLAAMLRGIPIAPTLTALPPPEPRRALPRAVAAWQAEQARLRADREREESEALTRATTPMRALADGKLRELKEPTVATSSRKAQGAAPSADQPAAEGKAAPIVPNASEPAPQTQAPEA